MKKKILVVDDEYDFVHFLKSSLERSEFETSVASDGEEAAQKVLHETPDLILLDLFMPNKDGFHLLRELKLHDVTRRIPIIIISAFNSPDLIRIANQFGVQDYFAKPCEFTMLLNCINKNLI